jgi:hypothetical protein
LPAQQRRRKREELSAATEEKLDEVVHATTRERHPLRGSKNIALRVGKILGHSKVGKHFRVTINEDSFSYERNAEKIKTEAALDGIYVIRTSVSDDTMNADEIVSTYKGLSRVEQAFRMMKSIDLKVRPVFHRLEKRVRAHFLLCMLAYYVDWHLRDRLAPLLFKDDEIESAHASRKSPVAKAQPSSAARKKAGTKRTDDGFEVQSLKTLLDHLGCITLNEHQPLIKSFSDTFFKVTDVDPLSARAFELLDLQPPACP